MSLFTAKANTPVVDSSAAITAALAASEQRMNRLAVHRDNALSAFRQTANQLTEINKAIDTEMHSVNAAISFYTQMQSDLELQKSDNTKVVQNILAIIGEEPVEDGVETPAD